MYAMECSDALRRWERVRTEDGSWWWWWWWEGSRHQEGEMEDGRCRSAGQGAWGQRVESIVCQMQTVGSLRRASLDTPAGRVETRDGESRVNFVEENLGGRSASLRLLDCGHAVVLARPQWSLRAQRRPKASWGILDEVCQYDWTCWRCRATSLSFGGDGVGRWPGEETSSVEAELGRLLTRLFFCIEVGGPGMGGAT